MLSYCSQALVKHIILIGFRSTFSFLYIDINIHLRVWLACFVSELKINILSAFISFARPVSFVFADFIYQNSARRGRDDLSFATARRDEMGARCRYHFLNISCNQLTEIENDADKNKSYLLCFDLNDRTASYHARNRFPFSKPRAGFKDTVYTFLNLGLTTEGLFAFFPQTYNYPEENCLRYTITLLWVKSLRQNCWEL